MKLFKSIILVALISGPLMAWASLNLPTPEVLLKKAGQNRTALREVVLDLEFNVPEMRDPATFEKYFQLLDQLQSLSVSSGLEEFFPLIVNNLGLNMVSSGMRWLDATKDSPTKLAYYIKWMDAETLARFLGLVEYQMDVVKDPVRLQMMAENLEAVLPLVDQKASSLPYVQLGFRRLISDSAVALLKTETLSAAQVSIWLKKIKISSSFSEYLDYLNQGIYSLNPNNKTFGHVYLNRLSQLSIQANNMSESAPNWLLNGVGDSIMEVVLRMVRFNEVFALPEFSNALGTLRTRHLQGLAQQWMAQEKLPAADYVEHYLQLSRILIERTKTVGLKKESDDLSKWLSKAAAPVMAQQLNLEGQYLVKNEKGEKWFFTVAVAKENSMVAALADAKGLVVKPFFNVSFNLQDDGFVASERDPDLDHEQNPPVKFSVDKNGQITVTDPYVRSGSRVLKGHKIQSFTDLWKTANVNAPTADGTYEGSLFLPGGNEIKVRLVITTFNGYTTGRIDSDNLAIDLNIGSQGNDGVVILTSGRKVGRSWFQLRANVTDKGLNAYTVVGGKGQGIACTFLKKIEQK